MSQNTSKRSEKRKDDYRTTINQAGDRKLHASGFRNGRVLYLGKAAPGGTDNRRLLLEKMPTRIKHGQDGPRHPPEQVKQRPATFMKNSHHRNRRGSKKAASMMEKKREAFQGRRPVKKTPAEESQPKDPATQEISTLCSGANSE